MFLFTPWTKLSYDNLGQVKVKFGPYTVAMYGLGAQ